ncbi:MAG: DUF4300 family protein [Ezakiella sp.]
MKTTKNILIIFTIFASLIYLITGCKDESAQPIEKIKVSNISSEEDRTICRDKLIESGLEEKRVDKFMEMVKSYNEDVNGELPYKNGFVETENIKTDYKKTVDEFYKTENKIGSNCRINTFELLLGNIEIKRVKSDNTSTLDFDKNSLENEFPELFTKDEITKFETYFAPVKAKISTDKKDQIAEIKKAVNSRGIKWNNKIDAKIISVWFHNDDEIDGNILFIGHTGVLVPFDDKLMFIEKLSFNEPYQAVIVNNRTELSDYLMEKYDVEYNQKTTRPFIFENGSLMKNFRQNPEYDKIQNK